MTKPVLNPIQLNITHRRPSPPHTDLASTQIREVPPISFQHPVSFQNVTFSPTTDDFVLSPQQQNMRILSTDGPIHTITNWESEHLNN